MHRCLITLIHLVVILLFIGCSSENEAEAEDSKVTAPSLLSNFPERSVIQFIPDEPFNADGKMCSQFSGIVNIRIEDASVESILWAEAYDIQRNRNVLITSLSEGGEIAEVFVARGSWGVVKPNQNTSTTFTFDDQDGLNSWRGSASTEDEGVCDVVLPPELPEEVVSVDLSGFGRDLSDYFTQCKVTSEFVIAGGIVNGGVWSSPENNVGSVCSGAWRLRPLEVFKHPNQAEYDIKFTPSKMYNATDDTCTAFDGVANYYTNENEEILIDIAVSRSDVDTITISPLALYGIPVVSSAQTPPEDTESFFADPNPRNNTFQMIGLISEGGQWLDTNGCFGSWSSGKTGVDEN